MKKLILLILSLALIATAQHTPQFENVRIERDLVYKTVDGIELKLDLYIPEKISAPVPLIIWIHGGGWRNGSKETCLAARLNFMQYGFAVASINYRLSGVATFPAQIEDCKAAVRWLRANGATYNLKTDGIGVWGASAGGHLSALLGTSGDVKEFDTGDNLEQSSRVQAVCDYYGPTHLLSMGTVPGFESHALPTSPESLMLGKTPEERKTNATLASPVTHITKDDPPFLIVYGLNDRTVPRQQSELFHKELQAIGVESEMIILQDAGHGGPQFSEPELIKKIAAFFERHLK